MGRDLDSDGNPIPGAPDPKGPKEPNVQPDTEERDADGNPLPGARRDNPEDPGDEDEQEVEGEEQDGDNNPLSGSRRT